MGFVIEMTHRKGGGIRYICAVKTGERKRESDGKLTVEFENTMVATLDEARRFPFESAEAAAYVVSTFPETKNISYRVIDTDEDEDLDKN